jgi:hypothetical protein
MRIVNVGREHNILTDENRTPVVDAERTLAELHKGREPDRRGRATSKFKFGFGDLLGVLLAAALALGAACLVVVSGDKNTQALASGGILLSLVLETITVFHMIDVARERRRANDATARNAHLTQLVDLSEQALANLLPLMSDLKRESSIALQSVRSDLKLAYADVATLFSSLSLKQADFESEMLECISYLINPSDPNKKYDIKTLQNAFHRLLQEVCDTAAAAIPRPKDVRSVCSVNIKFFVNCDKNLDRYIVLKRSNGAPQSRLARDKETQNKEYYVQEDKVYSSIFYPENAEALDYYIVPDFDDFLAGKEARFLHPSADVASFSKSCLLVPIKGTYDNPAIPILAMPSYDRHSSSVLRLPHVIPKRLKHRSDDVLGVICIDSDKSNYFDTTWDVQLMQQFSTQAFCCMRNYFILQNFFSGESEPGAPTKGFPKTGLQASATR